MKYFKVRSMLPKKEKWEKIEVESSLSHRLPYLQIIGIPPKVASFQRERVISALDQIGITLPRRKLTVNFPDSAEILDWKQSDLAVAACILGLMGRIPVDCANFFFVGMLSLDGRVGGESNSGTICLTKEEGTLISPPIFPEKGPLMVDRWIYLSHLENILSLSMLPVQEISPTLRREMALEAALLDWTEARITPLEEKLVMLLAVGKISCLVLESSEESGRRIHLGVGAIRKMLKEDRSGDEDKVQFFRLSALERRDLTHLSSRQQRTEREIKIQVGSIPHCDCSCTPCVCEREDKKNWDQKLRKLRSQFPLLIDGEALKRSLGGRPAIGFESIIASCQAALSLQRKRSSIPKEGATPSTAKKMSQEVDRWIKKQKNWSQREVTLKMAEILSDLERKEEIGEENILEAFFYVSELCWGNNFAEKGNSTAVPNVFSVLPVSDSSVRTTRLSN